MTASRPSSPSMPSQQNQTDPRPDARAHSTDSDSHTRPHTHTHTCYTFRLASRASRASPSSSDAHQISAVIGETWAEHFAHSVTPDDLAAYLAGPVSPEGIARDMDAGNVFVVAERERDGGSDGHENEEKGKEKETDKEKEIVGVAQLVFGRSDPALPPRRNEDVGLDVDVDVMDVELQRIYVRTGQHGSGLAGDLLAQAEREASGNAGSAGSAVSADSASTRLGPRMRRLWLGVWEDNHRAQRFYARSGFERVGEHAFIVGSSVRRDWIMVKTLEG